MDGWMISNSLKTLKMLIMPPTYVGRGHYKMMGGICPSVCHVPRLLRTERPRKPIIGRKEAHHIGILRSKGQRSWSQGHKVTSVKALLLLLAMTYAYICGGKILEQPRSTAMLFQRGCSFTLPPIDSTQVGSGITIFFKICLFILMVQSKIAQVGLPVVDNEVCRCCRPERPSREAVHHTTRS